jgi:hypothetical protein
MKQYGNGLNTTKSKIRSTSISMLIIIQLNYSFSLLSTSTHFQPYRIVTYRSIFFCVEVISSTLPLGKQRNTLRSGKRPDATFRYETGLKWKTGLKRNGHKFRLKVNWTNMTLTLRLLSTRRNFARGAEFFFVFSN